MLMKAISFFQDHNKNKKVKKNKKNSLSNCKLNKLLIFLKLRIFTQLFVQQIQMEKQKSTNLHDFEHQLFLGFLAQQPLKKIQVDISFIGGQPLWLYEPNQKLLVCKQCSAQGQSLTFLGQIFCPLNAKHCYNRIMYLFYCEKCRRTFKCIKQQTDENWQPKQIKQERKYKTTSAQAYEIQSDPIERKEMLKIINRSKIQVEQQIILEQEDENDDDEQGEQVVTVEKMTGEQMINKLSQIQKEKKNRQYSQKQIEEINKKFESLKIQEKDQKQETKQIGGSKKDFFFQQYIRTIKTLNNPIMIYSNIPIHYNKTPLNPKHTCKYCNSKLQLEIQITEKVLLFNKNLALLDWGSIFIYVCTGSCKESEEQCVVVQYQFDAVSEEEIAKLKKTKKTRKRNKNKSLSKQKKRLQGENQKIESKIIGNSKEQDEQEKDEQGDWD